MASLAPAEAVILWGADPREDTAASCGRRPAQNAPRLSVGNWPAGQRMAEVESSPPLAARMRSRSLDPFGGREAVIVPGRLLRRAIEAEPVPSLILWDPPGSGKTTLAEVIAGA